MKKLKLLMIPLICLLCSCTLKLNVQDAKNQISGTVPVENISAALKIQSTCFVNSVTLHSINENNQISDALDQTSVDEKGRFNFVNLSAKGIEIQNKDDLPPSHIIKFICGTDVLSRYVTSNSDQNIDPVSTILTWFNQTEDIKVRSVSNKTWTKLYQKIPAANTVNQAYQNLQISTDAQSEIIEIGLNSNTLNEASPFIRTFTVPSSMNENSVNILSATVYHWNPNYSFAYEWRLNGQLLSNSINYNYIPKADAQGLYTLQFFVGTNNGSGLIDTSKPYLQKIQDIRINNNELPTPPQMTLLSPSSVNTTAAQVRLLTGSHLIHCESFQRLAITEDSSFVLAIPPSNLSAFNILCSDNLNQDVPVTLIGTEGLRFLRLWAMDSSGTISSSYQEVTINYDVTSPIIAITSPSALYEAQTQVAVSGTCESQLSVNVSGTGATLNTFTCSNSQFSGLIDLSNGEGVKNIIFTQTDGAGNSSSYNIDFIKDNTAPAISIASPAANSIHPASITLTGSCESNIAINISGTGATSGNTLCLGGNFSYIANLTPGDGTKNIILTQTDSAGNSTSVNRDFIKDTTAPIVSFSSPAPSSFHVNSLQINGICESGLTISISGDITSNTTTSCNAGNFSQNITMTSTDGPKTILISQTDSVGNIGTATRVFNRDSTPPQLTLMRVNNAETATNNRNVVVDIQATSSRQDIHAFCLKLNSSLAPLESDPCWVNLTSIALTITDNLFINDFPMQVGAILGIYDIRAWVKDNIGNISSLTNTLNTDFYQIEYLPDPAPVISSLSATNTDVFSYPLTSEETTALIAADLYIKWSATDNAPIPSGRTRILYSTDETNYTLLIDGLSNSANGACTLDPGVTGCVFLPASSPTSSYYKIRVEIEDSGGGVSVLTSNAMNTGKFKAMAGNTSLGIGGSAATAILVGRYEEQTGTPDTQAFVVTKKGDIYFNYLNRGLAYISSATGKLDIVARDTNSTTGNGGPLTAASFDEIRRVILDYDDNLLIWDNNQIRKVDLSVPTPTISRIIGGGADTSDNALALSAQLPSINTFNLFTSTPDGRIYFEKSREIWYYDPTDLRVKRHLTLAGIGAGDMAGNRALFDWSFCDSQQTAIGFDKINSQITKITRRGVQTTAAICGSHPRTEPIALGNFDISTGLATVPHPPNAPHSSMLFTGMDGRIYSLDNGRPRLLRYDSTTNTFISLVGDSNLGRCQDGTLATQCSSTVMSAFVNEFGKVYYLDQGVIRTIDENGIVQTIAGQPRNFGIGENPISARFSLINFFDVNGTDLYVQNKLENQIVKLGMNGGNLSHVAGNGVAGSAVHGALATTNRLRNGDWAMPVGFIVSDDGSKLYTRQNSVFAYIDLTSGLWNVSSTVIQDTSSRVSYLAKAADRMLAYVPSHFGASGHRTTFREVDFSGNSSVVYGQDSIITSATSGLCDGVSPLTCTLQETLNNFHIQTQAKFHSENNEWIIGYYNLNYVNRLPLGGGTTHRLETTNNAIAAFDYTYVGPDMILFYCGTNGSLYKRNIVTNVETNLALPSSTIRCGGQSLKYDSVRNSLIFIYRQNDLYGIAEYTNPLNE